MAEKKTTAKKTVKKKAKVPAVATISHGVGRRKKSIARVWLSRGKGDIVVNGSDYKAYFDTEKTRLDAAMPFSAVPAAQNYNVKANIVGGGKTGQASALKLGIARALIANDEEMRAELRKHGLLTVDSRVKERKKPGQPGARKKFQFVKR